VRRMKRRGVWVALGSDIAGGAELHMLRVMTSAIRASKAKAIETKGGDAFLTVGEAYYLGTSAGARYFGDRDGFAPGNRLHAVVIDDGALPESTRPLAVSERFERAVYLAGEKDITAVYAAGKRVK